MFRNSIAFYGIATLAVAFVRPASSQTFTIAPPNGFPTPYDLTVELLPPLGLEDWEATAGSTIPVKFRLLDSFGSFVLTDRLRLRVERLGSDGLPVSVLKFCRPAASAFCDGDLRLQEDDFGDQFYMALWHTDKVQSGPHRIRIVLAEEDFDFNPPGRVVVKLVEVQKDLSGNAKGRAK